MLAQQLTSTSTAHRTSACSSAKVRWRQQLSARRLFLDIVSVLNAHGIGSNDIPAKLEGIAFGPDVDVNGVTKHTLFVANDNDFVGTVTDSNHPAGIDNPNRFFVFGVDAADVPAFLPQQLASRTCK
jgi:hypothetical protein